MGNIQTPQPTFQQLQHHSTTIHPIHGPSQIYISTKLPSCYIIKQFSPQIPADHLELLSQIENAQNIYLIGLFGYRVGKFCLCGQGKVVSDSAVLYWEFLSYSLREEIGFRGRIGARGGGRGFREDELWHVVKACAIGYGAFLAVGVCYDFAPSRLMINRQGRVRLDWMHLESKNTHSNFMRMLASSNPQLSPEQYLSPEQLRAIMLKQFTPKINFEKANIFSLGILLLECMTMLDPLTYFYCRDGQGCGDFRVNYGEIQEILAGLAGRTYSINFVSLVGRMLNGDPESRPKFQTIVKNYTNFFDKNFCIDIANGVDYPNFMKEQRIK